jgi:hypothetical protein
MILMRELAVRFFDLGLGGVFADPKDPIVIPGHG